MNLHSYQNLENGAAKLDLERLAQIAELLETTTKDLLRQDGIFIYQEIKEAGNSTGSGFNTTGNVYNYGVEKKIFEKLMAERDREIQLLNEEKQSFKDEIKYLKEKIDQVQDFPPVKRAITHETVKNILFAGQNLAERRICIMKGVFYHKDQPPGKNCNWYSIP